MWELTADNVLDYLRRSGRLNAEPAQVRVLAGGVSNAVFRIDTPSGAFVLKQSRPQLRTRAQWHSDPARIWREQEIIDLLHRLLPEAVPAVLFTDRDNYLFAMQAAPAEHRSWKQLLLAGQVDLDLGRRLGQLLGRLHQATAEHPDWLAPFADQTFFWQLRIEPFYQRVQARHPHLADALDGLIADLVQRREALCHGDYTPKNLLIHATGVTFIDHETACWGEPAMDLGLCLAHLLLKAIHRPAQRADYFALVLSFWQGYREQIRFCAPAELARRAIGHCGACLLARVDGASPVDYLSPDRYSLVRRLGGWLLTQRPETWEGVLRRAAEELA
jgi:5-methylthioribose kinase